MKKRIFTLLSLVLIIIGQAYAYRIDTLAIRSHKMDRNIEVVTVIPHKALSGTPCPVLYLLHGFSGNAHSWLNINKDLPSMADADNIIIVCPDGENSWYWDSPLVGNSQFETFVSSELVSYIDSTYPTIATRRSRAITGLSMGGHGALWLSLRHKDVFGACGSTSGGVDIRPFPKNWKMNVQLGNMEENKDRWTEHTVMSQLDKIKDGDLAIIFDCGVQDFFFQVNNTLHQELLKRNISHDYITRPGKHNLPYWNNSITYQWLFFSKFFKSK